jgi:hypothetical protein
MHLSLPMYPMKIWVLTLLVAPVLWILGCVVGIISLEVPRVGFEALALCYSSTLTTLIWTLKRD